VAPESVSCRRERSEVHFGMLFTWFRGSGMRAELILQAMQDNSNSSSNSNNNSNSSRNSSSNGNDNPKSNSHSDNIIEGRQGGGVGGCEAVKPKGGKDVVLEGGCEVVKLKGAKGVVLEAVRK